MPPPKSFSIKGVNCPIAKLTWHHDKEFGKSEQLFTVLKESQLNGIIKVRDTFTDFLNGLYEEE